MRLPSLAFKTDQRSIGQRGLIVANAGLAIGLALVGLRNLVSVPAAALSLSAPGRSLVLLVNTAEYFGNTYVERPRDGARFVFFDGEPIRLRLSIANTSQSEETVNMRAADAPHVFGVKAYRDGNEVEAAATIGEATTKTAGASEFVLPFDEQMLLKPREVLNWTAALTSALEPGSYRVDFSTVARDRNGRPVFPQGNRFKFEVRRRSTAVGPELLRRDAVRSFVDGRYADAEDAARRLLLVHANSAEAYGVLGDVAGASGNAAEATRHYDKALVLLTSGSDQLYITSTTPTELAQAIESFKSRKLKTP